jgi:hypothetical protein
MGMILKDFCFSMGMIADTHKKKVMIIKSKHITYFNFVYNNYHLEEVTSYKYLRFVAMGQEETLI